MAAPDLFPFQLDLVERVRAARVQGARIIVMQGACGSGKTSVASHIVKRAVNLQSRVLWLVHRRRLVDQISQRLIEFEVDHGVLMRGNRQDHHASVQVASRDTLISRCINNHWIGMPNADLIIVDEGHHAHDAAGDYRRILEPYPKATILLLSATPVAPDGTGLGPWAQAIVCAPQPSQLIRDGYLVPVTCYAPQRKKKGGRFLRGLAGDLVESWKQYAEDRPTVLFCSRVQHSMSAVQEFCQAGIPAVHVDASTEDWQRDKAFDDVAAGRIKVLSNVNIISEGVDVPELTCCQLFCEMDSRIRFIQATGRVMRTSPGKKYGIMIDHSGCAFRLGMPDEDTEWMLQGNVDEEFQDKHDAGLTAKVYYCKRCELAYRGSPACPKCGREPAPPPRSIFSPDPIRPRNELLVEVDRDEARVSASFEQKATHWYRCLVAAIKKGSTFGMAAAIYKKKFNEWPPSDLPKQPPHNDWKRQVYDVYPELLKKKKASG